MTLKHKYQRVAVFVDVANYYYSAKNLYGAFVNFGAVLQETLAGRRLIRALAYVIRAEIEGESKFFDALSRAGFEVKAKDLQIFAGGLKKGDWDVGLAMDAVILSAKVDAVILMTGDGDYVPLVFYLKDNRGCRVEVVGFGKTTSQKLIEAADEFTDLDANQSKYLIAPRRRREEK